MLALHSSLNRKRILTEILVPASGTYMIWPCELPTVSSFTALPQQAHRNCFALHLLVVIA